ncbi:exonuclease SbcC [Flavobacterium gillisiae]|uniref:Exonuclease SbcC n=1 Tax=Flavobacterium gillisiae TaxID=150146 RepID=A0A1H4A2P1_9FLAO|nr:AAA family ATPase [Flavobacterium gillisiae]SEA30078.1 exonuclease SbcC [Flavobacterium gillisiae]
MLPLKLSISGLYSYQKKQTIDFEELTNAGLFGIFGAVGSGKSSILEAIGFVLYGETERLNSRDKRSYNMLNLKSDRANIEFEFLNFEERKFKFVADWKRNKKRFEETTTIERLAYEWKEEEWVPMTSADATVLIGLTYENFRRTIIIPQGKFKEFLDLKGKDRSDMMKEIFHLQRFDLASKVATAQSAARTQLDQLKGALSGFEAISKETISALEEEVEVANTELQTNKTELELVETEFQKMTTLKTNFEDLEKKKSLLSTFIEQKPKMDALQTEIDTFEITDKAFKVVLNELGAANITLSKAKEQLVLLESNKKGVEESRKANQTVMEQLQPLFDQLETSKNKVSDLESIEKIVGLQLEVALIEKKSKASELLFLESEKKEIELKKELATIQTELVALKSKKLDGNVLGELGNWFTKQESLVEQLTTKATRISVIQDYLEKQKVLFSELDLPVETWKTVLDTKREQLSKENKTVLATKTKLLVSKELAHFAHNLHDGENCPLCGSLEHPHVMQAEDVSDQLAVVEATILKLENSEKEIALLEKKAFKIENDSTHAVEQLRLTVIDKEALESDSKIHLSKFIWAAFSATDNPGFLAKKQEQQIIEKAISETEKKEKDTRTLQEQLAEQLKVQSTNKGNIANEKAAISGAITNELSQLKVLDFAVYAQTDIAVIRDKKTKLHLENSRIASEYKLKSDAIVLQDKELAGIEASLKLISDQVVSNEQLVLEIQKKITTLLQTHQLDSIDAVQAILSKTWDIEVEKARAKQFAVDLKVAENAVIESEKLVMNERFDSTIFEDKRILVAEGKLKFETQLGKLSTLQDNLKRINASLVEKAALLAQFEVLNTRSTNLATLANMFNASGFVNYVSSIYLQNLADVANVRFHRMTKNQLSLTINTSNEFEVIDYLNDGASRSVKTLSGGQGFQASLCLALALAESVQSLNKNDKNFFFIDEGFGTQDPESVAIVFETLQSLYKENRIVGIISHVAELQERIPRSINVIKDEEHGSVVRESWR